MIRLLSIGFALFVTSLCVTPVSGQTLEETKAWLETDAVPLMQTGASRGPDSVILETSDVLFDIVTCELSWMLHMKTEHRQNSSSVPKQTTHVISADQIPLKDLDVNSIRAQPSALGGSLLPFFEVQLQTRAGVAASIQSKVIDVDEFHNTNEVTAIGKKARVFVGARTNADGDRVANAIRRAAVLCGAPASVF